jgi:hypothetical protein
MGASISQYAPAAYTGTATLGRVTQSFGAIAVTIVFAIVIVAGLVMQYRIASETRSTTGTVLSSQWQTDDTDSTGSYLLVYRYSVDNQTYRGEFTASTSYAQGESVTVYYDPGDPQNSRVDTSVISQYAGWIIAGGSLIFLALVWGWTYLVDVNKPLAAVSGAEFVTKAIL